MTAVTREAIDIIVPVYGAADDLRRCVESVLAHSGSDYRLTLIDDASPGTGVGDYFEELQRRSLPQVRLLRNERNLGFTGTANRGMRASASDVVLLNSDTEVTEGWLDALRCCAASDPRIGTITPFSNNAEICSYPRFCVANAWHAGDSAEPVAAALRDAAVPTYPDLPTGVGFCMYVRRALIDAIGVFDEVFGIGYGEENDFCLRAAATGWRNVLADDAFVVHYGERSFVGRKAELGAHNGAILDARHPHYTPMVREYIAADPLRALREAARSRHRVLAQPGRGILHVIHHHGGGTESHVRALIAASGNGWRHYLAIAVGDAWQLEEHRADGDVIAFELSRRDSQTWRDFIGGLCGTFGVDLIHLHNISGCREGLLDAVPATGIPYGYTVHDLNFACPTITFLGTDDMYCGAQTDAAHCTRCLSKRPEFAGIDVAQWRERHARLLSGASFIIAPSQWAAATLRIYFPELRIERIAHGVDRDSARSNGVRMGVVLPDDGAPTVAVLGAIGPDKGARRLERLVELARERAANVRFVLIGYLDVQHAPWHSEDRRFTVHGHYAPGDLPDLLDHYRVALVLYPSAGPETFSYTLSEAWSNGRPVLVPPIGALAERVAGSRAGFVMSEEEWRDEARMLDRIVALLSPEHARELDDAAAHARAIHHSSVAEMTGATTAIYRRVGTRASTSRLRRLPRDQVRDALGYRPWTPPLVAAPVADSPQDEPARPSASTSNNDEARSAGARVAQAALAIRHTRVGRLLYRLAPRSVVNALKARLPA
ncbi:MAG TPA: glycosyltransferase [Casimicrobiaceae bacterium]|nr:glycosyltransferase [Casimicrobiaceae bacterium]